MEKVKLMCSYGGKIQQRPHDLRFIYFGGHTKILTVDRTISFSNLLSKLQDVFEYRSQIQLKYKLPGQDLDALISVFDDDDVNHMMLEYDLLRRRSDSPARFRLFVFLPTTEKPAAMRSLNPDFLFGFDKEYAFSYVEPLKILETTDRVASVPGTVGYGAPKENPGGSACDRNVYPAPLVYRLPVNAGGYFQAVPYNGM